MFSNVFALQSNANEMERFEFVVMGEKNLLFA